MGWGKGGWRAKEKNRWEIKSPECERPAAHAVIPSGLLAQRAHSYAWTGGRAPERQRDRFVFVCVNASAAYVRVFCLVLFVCFFFCCEFHRTQVLPYVLSVRTEDQRGPLTVRPSCKSMQINANRRSQDNKSTKQPKRKNSNEINRLIKHENS